MRLEVNLCAQSSPFVPPLPQRCGERLLWGQLADASVALALASAAKTHSGLLLVQVADVQTATRLAAEVRFFLGDSTLPLVAVDKMLYQRLPTGKRCRMTCFHRCRNWFPSGC